MRKAALFLCVLVVLGLFAGCAQYKVKLYLTGDKAEKVGEWTTSADMWRGIFPAGVIFRDNTGAFGVMRGGLMGGGGGLDESFTTQDGLVVRILGEGTMIYEQQQGAQ